MHRDTAAAATEHNGEGEEEGGRVGGREGRKEGERAVSEDCLTSTGPARQHHHDLL
jgi:hypothetical protein